MNVELTEAQAERVLIALATLARKYGKDAEDARREMEAYRSPATESHFKKIMATAEADREETLKLMDLFK